MNNLSRDTCCLSPVVLLLLGLCLGLTGCLPGGPETEIEIPDMEVLYFEQVGHGIKMADPDTLRQAIRDSLTWATVAPQLQPARPFLPVDFAQMMVLVVAVPVEYGGYSIEVESVDVDSAGVLVSYVLSAPGSDCIPAMGVSTPFQVVQVRQVAGAVRFEERTQRYRCTTR